MQSAVTPTQTDEPFRVLRANAHIDVMSADASSSTAWDSFDAQVANSKDRI